MALSGRMPSLRAICPTARAVLFICVALLPQAVSGQAKICNRTELDSQIATYWKETLLLFKKWTHIPAKACVQVTTEPLTQRYYYMYGRREGGEWSGGTDGAPGCLLELFDTRNRPVSYEISMDGRPCPLERRISLIRVDTGPTRTMHTLYLIDDESQRQEVLAEEREEAQSRERRLAAARAAKESAALKAAQSAIATGEMAVGTVQKKCLFRWEDSHQLHSKRAVLRWNYQKVQFRMKKLEHCLEISVTAPIDVQGIAKSYLDQCVNHALNNDKVTRIFQLLSSVAADVAIGRGAFTSATIADYVRAAASQTVNCLTNATRINEFLGRELRTQFNATVVHRSEWRFWNL